MAILATQTRDVAMTENVRKRVTKKITGFQDLNYLALYWKLKSSDAIPAFG